MSTNTTLQVHLYIRQILKCPVGDLIILMPSFLPGGKLSRYGVAEGCPTVVSVYFYLDDNTHRSDWYPPNWTNRYFEPGPLKSRLISSILKDVYTC
jgi:hypothetical protein